ncbi:MAG TPA: ABC transporter permease [Vicinamibacterales bacterium]|nr:ABC transporter permease [Vicinamibacterales bacterium]
MTPGDDRDDRARQIDAELRFHHAQTIAELRRQGLSAEEAEREAARRFGDRDRWQDRLVRDAIARPPWRTRLRSALSIGAAAAARDVHYTARVFLRAPLFTLSTTAVFALGLGAIAIVLAVIHGLLLTPPPYPDADRLVYIWGRNPNVRAGYVNLPTSEPDLDDWRRGATRLASVGGAVPEDVTLTGSGEPERLAASAVAGDLFDALGVRALYGRTLGAGDASDGSRPVVLGHALWQRRFSGDPSVVGRTITLDGRAHRVVGVMPAGFEFPRIEEISANYGFAAEISIYVPWRTGAAGPPVRGNRYLVSVARLQRDATLDAAAREVSSIATASGARSPAASGGDVFALVPFQEQAIGGVRTTVWLVAAAAVVVLAIACLNVAHLLIVRLHGRRHELAVRRSLGASRASLLRQVLIEALMLGTIGCLAGVVGALLLLNALRRFAPPDLPRLDAVVFGGGTLASLLAVTIACALFVAAIAAASIRGRSAHVSLRDSGRTSTTAARSSRWLIGAEVALSVVLLLSAGLLVRSLWRVLLTAPGFDASRVLTFQVSLPAERYPTGEDVRRGYDRLIDAVRAVPGVDQAAYTWQLPMSGTVGSTSYTRADGESAMAIIHRVSPEYFDAMGIRLVRGRGLVNDGDLPPVVVNEALARTQWPGRDPIGEVVTVNAMRSRIVGIVGDVRHGTLEQPPAPEMYRLAFLRSLFIVVRTSAAPPAQLLPAIRAAVGSVDAAVPLSDVRTMADRLAGTTSRRRFVAAAMGMFAAIAMTLALAGLYGVTAMLVARRRREVGIRMALGATPTSAVGLLMGQAGAVIAIGAGIGVVLAALSARYLRQFLFETSPLDATTYIVVIAALTGAAAIAAYLPARRAAAVDPAVVLRQQ